MTAPYEGIIVLGFPRSGTTLLRRLLNAHPAISCPPETNLLSACGRFLYEEETVDGLSVGVVPGLAYSGIDESEILGRLRDIVLDIHRRIASAAGKRRWAEKTAFDIFHLATVERLFGESCRYVCMIRHPFDVVCSVKELTDGIDRYRADLHPYIQACASPYEAFAKAWADCNGRLLDFIGRHPAACFALRYEELLADPGDRLGALFAFLEEPTDVEALGRAAFASTDVGLGDWKTYATSGVSKASVGRGKALPASVKARLAPIVGPVMVRAGYEAVVAPALPEAADARRRYQAVNVLRQMKARAAGTSEAP